MLTDPERVLGLPDVGMLRADGLYVGAADRDREGRPDFPLPPAEKSAVYVDVKSMKGRPLGAISFS